MDYKAWINKIAVELAEISIMKKVYEESIKDLKGNTKKYILFSNYLYKMFYYSYSIRLTRIIEPKKKNSDDCSLLCLLETKYNNNKDIDRLKILYKNIEKFRNKHIGHLTLTKVDITWGETDNILQEIQEITNKYLLEITNISIKNWEILFNVDDLVHGLGDIFLENGKFVFSNQFMKMEIPVDSELYNSKK